MIIEQQVYNGDLIHDRFAYKYFKDEVSPVGNVVAFRAPMYVSDNLIDLEDSLNKDNINSEDAINFCWEIPYMCDKGAVAFQRLFNTCIANLLSRMLEKNIAVRGDDLLLQEEYIGTDEKVRKQGKISVSITHSKDGTALGHTGINIKAGPKAPGHAGSTNLTDEQVEQLMYEVVGYFNEEISDQYIATTKISV